MYLWFAHFLKDYFFWCGPFLKSLLNLLQYCFCVYILLFRPWGTWDLNSLTRDQTCTPCIGRWCLNNWTTREVPILLIFALPDVGRFSFVPFSQSDPKLLAYFFLFHKYCSVCSTCSESWWLIDRPLLNLIWGWGMSWLFPWKNSTLVHKKWNFCNSCRLKVVLHCMLRY